MLGQYALLNTAISVLKFNTSTEFHLICFRNYLQSKRIAYPAVWYEDYLQHMRQFVICTCVFFQSLDSFCIGKELWNSIQQSLVQTWAQHIHILKMLHRQAPTAHFQLLNYSYSIYAKHELQQSLEKNQTKKIISLHSERTVKRNWRHRPFPCL